MKKPIEIKTKDLQKIINKSYITAQRKINEIRKTLNKTKHQLVTPDEIAVYFGIPIDQVMERLNDKNK